MIDEDQPNVRDALLRALTHEREGEGLDERMQDIREITFFHDYMVMRVLPGTLLDRLETDELLRSDLELSLSAAFGRLMALKIYPQQL